MATTVKNNFNNYKIFYYSSFHMEATIYLYNDEKYVGRIVLMNDDSPLPDNGMFAPFETPQPSIHWPISRFNDLVNILREEKPLYIFLNLTTNFGSINTDDFEPVGEEEGR